MPCEVLICSLGREWPWLVAQPQHSCSLRIPYVLHRCTLSCLDTMSRIGYGAKPFVYDLALSLGVVPSRAVSLLRSTETHPDDYRFVARFELKTIHIVFARLHYIRLDFLQVLLSTLNHVDSIDEYTCSTCIYINIIYINQLLSLYLITCLFFIVFYLSTLNILCVLLRVFYCYMCLSSFLYIQSTFHDIFIRFINLVYVNLKCLADYILIWLILLLNIKAIYIAI